MSNSKLAHALPIHLFQITGYSQYYNEWVSITFEQLRKLDEIRERYKPLGGYLWVKFLK